MTDRTQVCTKIDRCRICGSAQLEDVISLGQQYIASLFPVGPVSADIDQRFPLHVVRCSSTGGCGLVQLEHTVSPEILYAHYGYRSGTNEMMRANLDDIVRQIEDRVSLQPDDIVLDIGCNDGTLLGSYSAPGIDRVGIDPSDAVAAIDAPDITVINDFFTRETFNAARPGKRARAVTSIAMFYDLDRPAAFVRDVAGVLADDGIWVMELSYLPAMLDANAFDTICHEHLEYYALGPLEWLLRSEGLEVRRVDVNDVNGGSFRLMIGRSTNGLESGDDRLGIENLRKREEELQLTSDVPYRRFRDACETIRGDLTALLRKIKDDGKRVYAYGASTKGNTLLQFCGLDTGMIEKAADRNPDKWGTTTIGTNIPIVSEDEAREDSPDYFLALPWHFKESFLTREQDFLANGGRFIFPLPQVHVIGGVTG